MTFLQIYGIIIIESEGKRRTEEKLYEVQCFKERYPFPDDSRKVRFKTKEEAVTVKDKYRKDGYMTRLVTIFYDEDMEDYFED